MDLKSPSEIEAEEQQRIKEKQKATEQFLKRDETFIKKLLMEQLKKELEEIKPAAAEQLTPRPAETAPGAAAETAKYIKEQGSILPISHIRPIPNKAVKEEGNVIVAKALVEQLGTSPEIKALMRIDERKMAVLQDATLAALSHMSYRFVYDKIRYWGHIVEWWLTGSQGIGGLGRRHILQALANSSGIQSVDRARKPNAISRNIFKRDWKEKAEAEGKIVED